MSFKLVSQKDSMGCAIACVASLSQEDYNKIKKLFKDKYANSRGYYCKEVVKILSKLSFKYKYAKAINKKKYLNKEGSIVFIKRSKKYPKGHYLLKTKKGWMNSWVNFPEKPVIAGYNKKLPGKAQWIIFPQPNNL